MDKWLQANKRLLIVQQVLSSRLAIRDFFLKTMVREVYENVGQVLSLVRMQLSMSEAKASDEAVEKLQTSGDLVGKSIRDLRLMCKNFFPDDDIVEDGGFIETFRQTLAILFGDNETEIKITGIKKDVDPNLKLILFNVLQDIAIYIKEAGSTFKDLEVNFGKSKINFIINYSGTADVGKMIIEKKVPGSLHLKEKLELISARFSYGRKKDRNQLKLTSPLNVDRDE